jgi:hypothetical protein
MSHDYEAAFKRGHYYNELVGEYLAVHGITNTVPALEIAKDKADRARFTSNEKDVVLADGRVIEVKGVSPDFGWEPESYTVRDTIIVDTESGYHGKVVKPIAYVFVSQVSEAMLVLSTKTYPKWRVLVAGDKNRGLEAERFLIADTSLLRSMDDLLKHLAPAGEGV